MTNQQIELPTVQIDGRDWSREKRGLWRAVQAYAKDVHQHEGERLDLNREITPAVVEISNGLYPHLSDYDREALCVEVIIELRSAFALVCEDGPIQ